ncbi:MAG TPA: FCD domain-containing protein, partial [Bryobacteraceae bacterium]|nr:FCD domain-containing protein [Bryobacteraceae bacterium]
LTDIMEAREFVERDLAGLAATRASEAELEAIAASVRSMKASLARGESILEADLSFHLAIAEAAHNQVLKNAVQLLRNLIRQWIVLKLAIPDVPAKVLKQHEKIFKAIRARDAAAARKAMWDHLEETAYLVTQVVQKKARPRPMPSSQRSTRSR